MIFHRIEIFLMKIDKNKLIEEFKISEELENSEPIVRDILLDVINNHNCEKHGSIYYQSASAFDSKCSKATNQSMSKPNPIVEDLGEQILKPLYDFAVKKEIS